MKYPLNTRGKNLLSIAVIFIVSIAIVGAAIWSMAILRVPTGQAGYTPHPAPAIWMDPNSTDNLNKSDTFTVCIVVNASAPYNLYLWQYNFKWNTSWVSLVDYTPVIKTKDDAWRLNWTQGEKIAYMTDSILDSNEHLYAVCSIAPNVGYSGVTWLCNYTFHVEDAPIQPASAYIGNFTLWLESLADDNLDEIIPDKTETEWVIGQYRILSVPIPPPELEVKPAKVQGVCGEKFNITIWINHLEAALNMCRWNATLSYDTTMLDAQASWEGSFLSGFGSTSYTYVIDDTAGTVYTAGSFVGLPANPPNETGVLATIEFNATWQYTVSSTSLPPIACSLSLYNTTLVDCANATIVYDPPINATYIAPYKPQLLVHPIEWPPGSGIYYNVFTESNSSVSPVPMIFNQPQKSLSFNVTGKSGYGFCNVTIPKVLLSAPPAAWVIYVDGSPTTYKYVLKKYPVDNNTHVSLYFTFEFRSIRKVDIEGIEVIPEFPIAMILPLLLLATLTAAILGKKVWSGKHRGSSVAE